MAPLFMKSINNRHISLRYSHLKNKMKFSAIGLITILVSSVVALPAPSFRPGGSINTPPPPKKGGPLSFSQEGAIKKGLNPNP